MLCVVPSDLMEIPGQDLKKLQPVQLRLRLLGDKKISSVQL